MAYGLSNGHVADDVRHMTLKGQTRKPNTLRVPYLENGWRVWRETPFQRTTNRK